MDQFLAISYWLIDFKFALLYGCKMDKIEHFI